MSGFLELPLPAKEVHRRYWDGTIPVNPIALAHGMGVQVYQSPSLPVIGEFYYDDDGNPVIIFQPSGYGKRDRFTVAHELGHFCLQHGQHGHRFRDQTQNFNIHNFDPKERAANRFAAELLMPENVVLYAVRQSDMKTVEEMSNYFDVSGLAMRIRLQGLGIL